MTEAEKKKAELAAQAEAVAAARTAEERKKMQEDGAAARLSPEFILQLAPLVKDEHLKLFDAELAEALVQARKEIDRTNIVVAQDVPAPAGDVRLNGVSLDSQEQSAEYMRCAIARMCGVWNIKPDPRLDVGGRITQALTPISGAAGGYLLPDQFIQEVQKRADEPAVVWPHVNKRPATSRTVIKPEVTTYITPNQGTSASVNSATTATEITVTQPVFTQEQWDLEDSDARMPVKLDLLDESPIDVYQELIALCADAFSVTHENDVFNGTGHANLRALGVLNSSSGITSTATGADASMSTLLAFLAELPKRYRARAKTFMGSSTLFFLVQSLATNVRAAQFLQGFIPAMDDSEYIPEGIWVTGDWSRYVVYYLRFMSILTSIAAERKMQEIVVTECWTGKPTIVDAFRIGTTVGYS